MGQSSAPTGEEGSLGQRAVMVPHSEMLSACLMRTAAAAAPALWLALLQSLQAAIDADLSFA